MYHLAAERRGQALKGNKLLGYTYAEEAVVLLQFFWTMMDECQKINNQFLEEFHWDLRITSWSVLRQVGQESLSLLFSKKPSLVPTSR